MSAYRVSFMNQYLAETDNLSEFQMNAFWSSVKEASVFHGRNTTTLSPEKVVEVFNSKHVERMRRGDGIGLGGRMRAAHARKLLRTTGYTIKEHQIAARHADRKNAPVVTPKRQQVLTRECVETLSFADCKKWLLKIGRPLHSTKPKRHKELYEFFDGKARGYRLML